MQSIFRQNLALSPRWLRFFIVILLVLGILFRFVNIDRKVYWNDEAFTSLRIAGYTDAELVQQVFDGREIGIEDLHKYQRPNTEKGLSDTIRSLAVEDPQHPPLYYVMARFWVQWFGSSVATTRSFSALISLLALPCIYWLSLELFESPLIGWVAMALIAVSPLHLLYAQEARQYSLWTVTILLSSASLLRALRLKTKLSWAIYAVTVAAGLYTFLFSALVVIAHGIYVLAVERFQLSKTVRNYLVSSLAGILAFFPWIIVVLTNLSRLRQTTGWTSYKLPLLFGENTLVKIWNLNLSRIFFDIDFVYYNSLTYLSIPLTCLSSVVLLIVGYSFYFICRNAAKRVWLFVLLLTGIPAIILIGIDLIKGGLLSALARYLFPFHLGIQLCVAYLLAIQISSLSERRIQLKKLWPMAIIALGASGVFSCAIASPADVWWHKVGNYSTPPIARIINQATRPLVISDTISSNVLALSYMLEPKVRFQLVVPPNVPKVAGGFSDVFLFKASKTLRETLKKDYKLELARNQLWRLEKTVQNKINKSKKVL
jgi:uncharacterized membrane protein